MSVLITFLLLVAPSAASSTMSVENVALEINRVRQANGLAPLQLDPRLCAAAESRVDDMIELQYWDHVAPDGRSPFSHLRRHHYQAAAAGENLATGFDTPALLVSGWMESKGHRENLLGPYEDVGISILEGSPTGRAHGFSVVVLFGSEASGGR